VLIITTSLGVEGTVKEYILYVNEILSSLFSSATAVSAASLGSKKNRDDQEYLSFVFGGFNSIGDSGASAIVEAL
jgi:hypothetical protein